MGIEIERKFLLASDAWRSQVDAVVRIRQGYVTAAPDRSIRVRVSGSKAWLTLKFGPAGPAREEFEYAISLADADAILAHAVDTVDKDRHIVPWQGHVFEIDVFHGTLEGLVLAELETDTLIAPDRLPDWIGREVTGDARYYNAVLARDGLPEERA